MNHSPQQRADMAEAGRVFLGDLVELLTLATQRGDEELTRRALRTLADLQRLAEVGGLLIPR